MGGGQDAEAGGKAAYSSGDLPPSAPPHLQDQQPHQYQYGTFQPPPHAASAEFRHPPVGFPQPAPPPGFGGGGGGGHHHHHQQQPYAPAEPQPPPHAASAEFRHPPVGFPQPAPPPGFGGGGGGGHHHHHHQQPYAPAEPYYAQGYQAVPGFGPVVEGRPVRMRRLPCCGLGLGWFLFIAGFFLAAIPWYVGAFVLICVRVHDYREKPGYVACTIAAAIAAVAILLGVTKGTHVW